MGWVKEANKKYKFSRYRETRWGYRIYTIRPHAVHEYNELIEGNICRVTSHIQGKYVAINNKGWTLRKTGLGEIMYAIDLFGQLKINPNEFYNESDSGERVAP